MLRYTHTLLSLLLAFAHRGEGASEAVHHPHRGILKPYELGPPDILLSAQDERILRSGRRVTQALVSDDDSRRVVMVQDIKAPSHIVLSRIMDLDRYDQMVQGVDACVTYASAREGTQQTVKSTYEISAMHLKLKYFVKHVYDPAQRCMVFTLDYDRKSDLDDSVGYWYVEPGKRRNTCRVFYSCECKLRGWVPPPVLNLLQKEALKKATTWVNEESLKEWHATRACQGNDALIRFVSDVRDSMRDFRLPPVMARRKQAAVHFVSNVRSSKARKSQYVGALMMH